jgi:hypothetical protein
MDDALINPEFAITTANTRWHVQDIDFSAVDTDTLSRDPTMLWLATASSFVESASDVYTQNLLQYFSKDAEISRWLMQQWKPEELQHGRALRAYVEAAWPEFDWQAAFDGFLLDYAQLCRVEVLGPTFALELASRCVIETATSTLYRAVRDATTDPVLRKVADNIQRDKTRHFKYFFYFFRQYQIVGGTSRWAIAKMLAARASEIRDSDTVCALRHIRDGLTGDHKSHAHLVPDASTMNRLITTRLRRHYPLDAAIKMLLAPMALPAPARKLTGSIISIAARTKVAWSLL